MTVDEFVASKMLPEFRPVVAAIRKVMKENAPGVSEVISYGIPMHYAGRVTVVALRSFIKQAQKLDKM